MPNMAMTAELVKKHLKPLDENGCSDVQTLARQLKEDANLRAYVDSARDAMVGHSFSFLISDADIYMVIIATLRMGFEMGRAIE